ncbi:phenylacetic acid degradation protein [Comamonadaceae bacterium OH2545_COT-014]|nr:phenylacetic acid degradation protein [Comamonadaceae bacterium OH2545_COT-014]
MGLLMQIIGLLMGLIFVAEGLKRLGIDVGWLNPLTFFRRRAWKKKITQPPLYALEHPVDVVGVLALAVAQAGQAQPGAALPHESARASAAQALLRQHLSLDEKAAQDLWLASAHLLRAHPLTPREVPAVLTRSAARFTPYHQDTLRTVLHAVAHAQPPVTAEQQALLDAVAAFFARHGAASANAATSATNGPGAR